jgi:hypothetical protein
MVQHGNRLAMQLPKELTLLEKPCDMLAGDFAANRTR